jgi:hypothetical protein
MALPQTRPAISSTKTARDLLAAVRSHLVDMGRDVRELADDLEALRADLATDWRYLRADIATDWSNLAYQACTGYGEWRDRRRQVPPLTPFPAASTRTPETSARP